jgi:hypothetical protein
MDGGTCCGMWSEKLESIGDCAGSEVCDSSEQDLKNHIATVETLGGEGGAAEDDVVDRCSVEHDADLAKSGSDGAVGANQGETLHILGESWYLIKIVIDTAYFRW